MTVSSPIRACVDNPAADRGSPPPGISACSPSAPSLGPSLGRRRSAHRRPSGAAVGRGFSTMFHPDLSTRRNDRWTGLRAVRETCGCIGHEACRAVRQPGRDPVHVRPSPGPSDEPPALVGTELEAGDRVVGEQEAAVEVDPVRQRRDDGRGGDPDRRLLHAAQERPEPEGAGALEHPPRRADPAALGELDVDAGHDPDQPVEVVDRHGALVRDERQRRARLERAEVVEAVGRERLLDQLDAEPLQLRQQVRGLIERPAGVGVDADRARRTPSGPRAPSRRPSGRRP